MLNEYLYCFFIHVYMISVQNLKEKLRTLKKDALMLPLALADSRTPLPAKLLAAVTLVYLLSPLDLIPDFIPVSWFTRRPTHRPCPDNAYNKANSSRSYGRYQAVGADGSEAREKVVFCTANCFYLPASRIFALQLVLEMKETLPLSGRCPS